MISSTNYSSMQVIKQNLGIEVDAKKLKVSFQFLLDDLSIKVKGSRSFDNTATGFKCLAEWLTKKRVDELPVHLTMEATGVYYEHLAYDFHTRSSFVVHVVLPNVSKAFLKSLNLKSKTDEVDAKGLGRMGLERQLSVWQPMSTQMRQLRKLVRERLHLLKEKTMVCNQLHAERTSYGCSQSSLQRYEDRLAFLDEQIEAIEKELHQTVKKDKDLQERIDNVCTAKGLGFITVIGVVAEMNGFTLFNNRNQVVSYTGYDVVEKESGTSVRGRSRISKKGNSYVRQMLFMAAMSAAVHDDHHKAYYQRIVEKTSLKMKANVAIQRKLLLLIYALFKNNVPYDPKHHLKLREKLKPKNNPKSDKMPVVELAQNIKENL